MSVRNMKLVDEKPGGARAVEEVYIEGAGGGGDYTLPEATTSAIGGVKKAAAVAAVSASDAAAAAGDTVTKAEFDAVVTLCNELKSKLNSVISNDKAAGQMA